MFILVKNISLAELWFDEFHEMIAIELKRQGPQKREILFLNLGLPAGIHAEKDR
jgi:hypothetical protein